MAEIENKINVLELFKGSGSISKHFANKNNYNIISLDILEKYNPTICCDILEWDYSKYPKDYFNIIWASPECKIFSALQNTWIGRKWKDKHELQQARDQHSIFIIKTIEIINYFNPTHYFVENPLHSKIWDYVPNDYKDKFLIVDYCYFGYHYKKPTKILTNKKLDNKRCSCASHNMRLGITGFDELAKRNIKRDDTTQDERYSIPPKLLDYLFT